MNSIHRLAIAIIILTAAVASCEKKERVMLRDTNKISVLCTKTVLTKHWVLCDGSWRILNDVPWLEITPTEGSGDGVEKQYYTITVAYNDTDSDRSGTYIISNGIYDCSILVTQKACTFEFTSMDFIGELKRTEESKAILRLFYKDAGAQQVTFTAELTGEGSTGLYFEKTDTVLVDGDGYLEFPLKGTPTRPGNLNIKLLCNDKPFSHNVANVTVAETVSPYGIPCGWNFYDLGYTADNASEIADTELGRQWTQTPHKIKPTSGDNEEAYFTAVASEGVLDWSFNPSIQAQGLKLNDYWLACIPVRQFTDETRIVVELGCGGSGGSVGYYFLEYSTDGSSWTEVPGAQYPWGKNWFKAHLWNTNNSISAPGFVNTRQTYVKKKGSEGSVDYTFQSYEFHVPGLYEGVLYLRLKVLKYRATATPDMPLENNGTGWTDIKGLDIYPAS